MLFPNVYLVMLNYPYCKINVLKTWTASFRAPQNPCTDNWNNLNFVLTLLATATKLNSFFLFFFFIFRKSVWFLGIINFYIYSPYPPLGWITIQNTLHFWTICISRIALYLTKSIFKENWPNFELQNCTCGCRGTHLQASE